MVIRAGMEVFSVRDEEGDEENDGGEDGSGVVVI